MQQPATRGKVKLALVALFVALLVLSTGFVVYYTQTQGQIKNMQSKLDGMQSSLNSMQASLDADQSIIDSGGFRVVTTSLHLVAPPASFCTASICYPNLTGVAEANYTVPAGFLLVFAVSNDTAGLGLLENGISLSQFNWAISANSGEEIPAPFLLPGMINFYAFYVFPGGPITVRVGSGPNGAVSANISIIFVNKFIYP